VQIMLPYVFLGDEGVMLGGAGCALSLMYGIYADHFVYVLACTDTLSARGDCNSCC